MRQTGCICNRIKGTGRCLNRIKEGKCPVGILSGQSLDDCCGRQLKGRNLILPRSIYKDENGGNGVRSFL